MDQNYYEPDLSYNFNYSGFDRPSQIPIDQSPPQEMSIYDMEDLEDSLIMGNEELSTIPKKESDEVIKSTVEDLVPIPSESEDTSGSDSDDDDLLFDKDVLEDNVKIYSNPLFEFDEEYISSNVNYLFDEVLEYIESKALLVTHLFDSYEDECFDPGGDVDEFNAFDNPLDLRTITMTQREMYSILRVCLVMILPLISLSRCS
nr:hypothetical protein [Tanacetum cinerariifolium]